MDQAPVESPRFLKFLRVLGLVEGCSTLLLFFVAMPLKYGMDIPEAVRWPGRIHGGLFVLLVASSILAIRNVPLSPRLAGQLVIAAVVPFGPFVVDRKLKALGN